MLVIRFKNQLLSQLRSRVALVILALAAASLLTAFLGKGASKDVGKEASPLKAVYLTFQKQTTTDNMTVNFFSEIDSSEAIVYYDTQSQKGQASAYRFIAQGSSQKIKKKLKRTFYHVELTGLHPNTTYYFVAGNNELGFSKEYKFKTLPPSGPIRLVEGGDMGPGDDVFKVAKSAMAKEPDVILLGGDLAYADGKLKNFGQWESWFDNMMKTMITPSGYLVPLIAAIGNHETKGMLNMNDPMLTPVSNPGLTLHPGAKGAPIYFALFPQSGKKSFYVRYLSDHTVLFVLDSGHAYWPWGEQKKWLKTQMEKHQNYPNKIALYHYPLYPSHRSYTGLPAIAVRRYWLKIFDKFNLTLAFENHDHTLKRTKMLRDNQEVDHGGTVYVGDGCWGRGTREAKQRWYLEKSQSVQNVWLADLSKDSIELKGMGKEGVQYDHFSLAKGKVIEIDQQVQSN